MGFITLLLPNGVNKITNIDINIASIGNIKNSILINFNSFETIITFLNFQKGTFLQNYLQILLTLKALYLAFC